MPHFMRLGLAIGSAALVGGCSTLTPDFSAPGVSIEQRTLSEQHLINHVQCQLVAAVRNAYKFDSMNAGTVPKELQAAWLNQWGAKVSLVMSIDDKDNLSPSLSLTQPLENALSVFKTNGNVTTAQNRSLGLTGTFSSDATRTETIGFFYSFQDLLNSPIDTARCKASEGLFLSSDLKVADFLQKGLDISFQPGILYRQPNASPYETFTYEVKFIVTAAGGVTPAWKLVKLSANQSTALYTATRIHTDDLTITMGKIAQEPGKGPQASPELTAQHNANLIGQAVANALQGHPLQ